MTFTIQRIENGYLVTKNGRTEYQENLDKMFDIMRSDLKRGFSNQRQTYEFTYEIKESKNNGN